MAKKRVFTDLIVKEVSLVSAGANQPAFVTLLKSKDAENQEQRMEETQKNDGVVEAPAAEIPSVESPAPEAPVEKTEAEATPAAEVVPAAEPVVEKAMVTELEKAKADLEKAVADLAAKQAELEKAQAAIEAERIQKADLEKQKVELEKAEVLRKTKDRVSATMKGIPGTVDELAKTLIALGHQAAGVESILVKCSALIEKGALSQTSSVQAGEIAAAGTASARFEQLALAKMKTDPKLNKYSAQAAVLHENPALYGELENEKAGA